MPLFSPMQTVGFPMGRLNCFAPVIVTVFLPVPGEWRGVCLALTFAQTRHCGEILGICVI